MGNSKVFLKNYLKNKKLLMVELCGFFVAVSPEFIAKFIKNLRVSILMMVEKGHKPDRFSYQRV